jgi:hypothetical protein
MKIGVSSSYFNKKSTEYGECYNYELVKRKIADSTILQAMNTQQEPAQSEQSSSLAVEQAATTDQQHITESMCHKSIVHEGNGGRAEIASSSDDTELSSGCKVPFDNFDIYQRVRDMTEDHQNIDIHWVNHNVVFNRLSGYHLPDDKPISSIKDLDNAKLLPSMSDHSCQRLDYIRLVQRVLTNNLQCLGSLKGEVTNHIPNQYSDVMCKKTEKVEFPVNFFLFLVGIKDICILLHLSVNSRVTSFFSVALSINN